MSEPNPRSSTGKRKLLVAISAHGFGHLSQISPVLNRLRYERPGISLTVQTTLSQERVAQRIEGAFELLPYAADRGVLMAGPTVIRWQDTITAHQVFHAHWQHHLASQIALFERARPDLVLVDIPYLSIAAANALDIPVVAFCSLNWADILSVNTRARHELADPIAKMREQYAAAEVFIQPEPSMPMAWLPNRSPVGAVFKRAPNRRGELLMRLDCDATQRLVLVGLGGIPMEARIAALPEIPGVHWLVSDEVDAVRPDIHDWTILGWNFLALLASVDVLVTKPGYGSYTEAAGLGMPVLSIRREDWGESPVLDDWLARHVPFRSIDLDKFLAGDYRAELLVLLEQPRAPALEPDGILQSIALLEPFFG